ncbi:MAG TPA: serine/threonine-protein kinase [Candidatus Limnocylindrales bacterium]|nr:serine/threonine-protein kinase [Candidatus Limnocylindrales bacterium]
MRTPGDHLADRYRIVAALGAGGMATVHRALDERLQREVALKVLLPNLASDPLTAQRFEREARAMAAVAHPGLVAVFDVDAGDQAAGREPFVVMELCPGGSLADRMGPGRPLPPDELIPILVAVADALAALHHGGLVHRDVKPSNILFATDRVKLADFGLVRSEALSDASQLTDPGTAIGTLAYLAPERLRGDPGGPPADVYALATIAHLGLTGSLPRAADSVHGLVAAAPFRPPAVSTVAPALGTAFDAIVLDGLAIDPGRRPDAVTFGSRLGAALGAWTRAGRPGAAAASTDRTGAALAAVASTSPRATAHEADDTTALALPIEATAPIAIGRDETASERDRRPVVARSDSRRRGVPLALAAAIIAALALWGLALGIRSALGPPTPPSTSATISLPVASTALPSASAASPPPSALATVAPTADPAVAALNEVAAAIEAVRGGHGVKGKEANELEADLDKVRNALAASDRDGALAAARDLDRRVRDVAKHLEGEGADRLRAASSALLAALGG